MSDNNENKPRGFSNKKNIIIIALAAVLALGGGITAVSIGAANRAERSVSSGIQLAERYLWELKYEQAIIEFQRVLEIEPRNVEAYLGLAKAYVGLGDTEKALETLRKGLEMTGDPRIQAMIDELSKPSSVRILGREYDVETTTYLYFESPRENIDDQVLKEIAQLTNLEELLLCGDIEDDVKITDISPLGELHNLRTLRLDHRQISDITPLAKLTNLENLILFSNQISDITPLAELENLKYLDLTLNPISDITPLAGLTGLTELEMRLCEISDLTPLSGLTNLTKLDLEYNPISDIAPLSDLVNLTYLDLTAEWGQNEDYTYYRTGLIEDITPLGGLTNLTKLYLSSNPISDFTPVANLKNLTWLHLGETGDSPNFQINYEIQEWIREQLPNCEIQF